MAADLSTGNAVHRVAEDKRCDDVEEAHHGRQNARGNDNTPKWETQVADTCSALVEIAQDVEAQDYHGQAKEDEAGLDAEHRPISCKV